MGQSRSEGINFSILYFFEFIPTFVLCYYVSHLIFLMVLAWALLQYTIAMMGYDDDEMKTTVLELTYNYGVTDYTKGDGYAQVCSY